MSEAAATLPEPPSAPARATLRARLAARWHRWIARRQGADALPLRIDRRRIYILPSRHGLMLAAVLLAMLLAALNYSSNLTLGYAFLLIAIGLVAMHHCHRNLLGLEVDLNPEADAMAGGQATFQFVLANASALERIDIEVRLGGARDRPAVRSVPGRSRERLNVEVPTPERGLLRLERAELTTRQPLSWFRAWTYIHTPLIAYVAPRPHGERPLPLAAGGGQSAQAIAERRGDEEFAGLRSYVPGVPLKHMAWKVLAQGREAAVRSYAAGAAEPAWLEWSQLEGLDVEARLAQLCRWVLDCDRMQRPYGLRLPGNEIAPGAGLAHRSRCLRALALHGHDA